MVISGKLIPKYVVGLLVIIVAICIFIPTVLLPYLNTSDEVVMETLKNQEEVVLYEMTLNNLDDLQARVQELKTQWEQMEDEMFIKDEFIVNDLSNMMNEVGFSPLSIAVQDESEVLPAETSSTGDSLYSVPITMSFTVSKEMLLEFINTIENKSDGIYIIGDLNCTTVAQSSGSGEKSVGEGDLNVTMSFTSFYFKDVPASVSPTQATTVATS